MLITISTGFNKNSRGKKRTTNDRTARHRVRTNELQLILQFVRVFANNLGDRDARMNHRDAPFLFLQRIDNLSIKAIFFVLWKYSEFLGVTRSILYFTLCAIRAVFGSLVLV